ncbi:MAG: ATP-binding protein [Gemmatimonadota bacterium]|nr:ATP-binding protein [Gemmatimonadota bacterium]
MHIEERSSRFFYGQEFVLSLPSNPQLIEDAVAVLVRRCEQFAFGGSRLYWNFRVGVSEALTNAVLHGNRGDPGKEVRVEVRLDDSRVALKVIDQGNGFDPSTVPDPTLPDNLERTGGRGVFIMCEMMDEVEFIDPGNAVRLVLRREPPPPPAPGE